MGAKPEDGATAYTRNYQRVMAGQRVVLAYTAIACAECDGMRKALLYAVPSKSQLCLSKMPSVCHVRQLKPPPSKQEPNAAQHLAWLLSTAWTSDSLPGM